MLQSLPLSELDAALSMLPEVIAIAILQSGIQEYGGDFGWLTDERVIKGVLYAHEAHGGKTRKRGNRLRLIHEVFCAHHIHNNQELQTWINRQQHVTPALAVFGMVVHDCVENFRDCAKEANTPFDENAVIKKLAALWGEPSTFVYIHEKGIRFMTDAADLRGKNRINAQIEKAFDKDRFLCIDMLQQCWRMYDKFSNVCLDAMECRDQLFSRKNAANCYTKAHKKRFVLEYPAAKLIEREYWEAMEVLEERAWRGIPRTFHESVLFSFRKSVRKALARSIDVQRALLKMTHSNKNAAGNEAPIL